MKIKSPNKVKVSKETYVRTHRKQPRGFGMWAFRFIRFGNVIALKFYTNKYSAAVKSARIEAAVLDCDTIIVMD